MMNAGKYITGSLIWTLLMLWPGSAAQAMDSEGCLSCHQFPGLVRVDRIHTVKLLHIDETRYLDSAHGKLACRQCHPGIELVPHTGVTRINCNSQCHLKDKEKVDRYPMADFHRREQSAITVLTDPSSCRICHDLYPHYENRMVRAFLNMHTGFMHCTVCHLKKENHPEYAYDWNGAEKAQFSGEPFGTFYNPKLSKAHKSRDFISRITVFTTMEGRRRPLLNTGDVAEAKEFLLHENSLTAEQKKQRLAYFHRDINRKEISVACEECHSAHGILDLTQLGFDEKARHNLININIKGLVTHYKTFFFPKMFDQ